ncbi:MAG: XkdX family protein [Oscillospiraceae bacterium]|nr:XkdX family protein [Oscillospiraceae bacterium]
MNFETIKRNYDRKLWSKAQVRVAVKKGVITTAEYKEITGEEYQ